MLEEEEPRQLALHLGFGTHSQLQVQEADSQLQNHQYRKLLDSTP